MSMQATDTDPRKSIKTQYGNFGNYHRGSSNKSDADGVQHTENSQKYPKPRAVSGKKKYGSLLAKSPQLSRKKHVKTEEKTGAIEQKFMQRKKSNSNGVRFFCENSSGGTKNTSIMNTGVSGTSYKNSLEKRTQGKKMS